MIRTKQNILAFTLCHIVLCTLLLGCDKTESTTENTGIVVDFIGEISDKKNHIEEPYLYAAEDGSVYISWLEKSEETATLKFAEVNPDSISDSKIIASGSDWFVNWADYPQFSSFTDGTLLSTFLQKSGPGTFAYDVKVSLNNNVDKWSTPNTIHEDATQTEHGFVSLSPWGENMLITWLDGRNTGGGHDDHNHHGQMTLRAATVDRDGKKLEEWELDNRVCDCCQTGSVVTDKGPIVVYRDRSENETRDIGIVRFVDNKWLDSETVYFDNWQIAACPVNGPRIDAMENYVAVIWYSGAQEKPSVKIAFSENYGEKFDTPIQVDLGKTIGRVNLTLVENNMAFVTWMEEGNIWGRTIRNNGEKGKAFSLVELSEKRSSGFPQIARSGNFIYLAYTDDSEPIKKIKLSKIDISQFAS